MISREDIAVINRRLVAEFEPPVGEEAWSWRFYSTSGTAHEPIVSIAPSRFDAHSALPFVSSARPLICVGSMGMRLLYTKFARKDPVEDNRVLVLDRGDLRAELMNILSDYRPDRIVGAPSFMLKVASFFDKESAQEVKELHFAGEAISLETEKTLRTHFPNAMVRSLYGSIEFGAISRPSCAYLPRNWHHPAQGITVEIDSPDESGVGDILVSGKKGGRVDIVRYQTGDIGCLKKERCPCGEEVSFEVLGRRGYDYVKLAGAILRQEEFDRVSRLVGAWDDYRAVASPVVSGGRQKGKILIEAYSSRRGTPAFEREAVERFSRELYLTPTRTLAELVAQDMFLPLEVRWVDRPFPPAHKVARLRSA